mgnify:FL=1
MPREQPSYLCLQYGYCGQLEEGYGWRGDWNFSSQLIVSKELLFTHNSILTLDNNETLRIDESFMRMALKEAEKAGANGEIPIGAVVVCKGRIISRAHNLTETLHDVTAHAEMQAITAAANMLGGKYLTDCTLYVTVEPCVMCAGALGWSQIPRVVFGASDEKRGFLRYAPNALHPKTTVTSGILEEECRTIMQEFFKGKR